VRDILGYEGKRVIVTGAASGIGAATAAILVDLGVEVHAIDIKKPDVTSLASYTECDLRDPDQIDAAVDRIGKIVNALFNCADASLVDFAGLRHLTEALVEDFLEGSAVASLVSTSDTADFAEAVNAYTERRAVELAPRRIRINCMNIAGGGMNANDGAWPLVFLNSPRASSLTGAQLSGIPNLRG
jgi:hypothetical protein